MNKQTLIIVSSSAALGFLGDVITYSVAASAGKKFNIHFPKGKDLALVIITGVITGFIIDYAVKEIQRNASTEMENALDDLVQAEKKKIQDGQIKNAIPKSIVWERLV